MIGISLHHGWSKTDSPTQGVISNPSGSSWAAPPTRVISLAKASRRFVSCPRKWPMPIMRVGLSAKARIAASDGAISPAAVRVEITQAADMTRSPVTSQYRTSFYYREADTRAPIRSKISRQHASGLRSGFRPMRYTHGSAGDQRGAQERSGIRQVRFDRHQFRATARLPAATVHTRACSSAVDIARRNHADRPRSCEYAANSASSPPCDAAPRPPGTREPISNSPEMNCEDPEESMLTTLGVSAHWLEPFAGGVIVNGSRPSSPWYSIHAPNCSRPSNTGFIGRAYACSSPSKATGPSANMARPGTKRITVPARPQNTFVPPWNRPSDGGTTVTVVSTCSSISQRTPNARNASIINSVSRERNRPTNRTGSDVRAPRE